MFTGSSANITITTGSVSDVVAVPTSAVQSLNTRTYVLELDKGELTRKVIKVGMIGNELHAGALRAEPGSERGAGGLRRGGALDEHQHHTGSAAWEASVAVAACLAAGSPAPVQGPACRWAWRWRQRNIGG